MQSIWIEYGWKLQKVVYRNAIMKYFLIMKLFPLILDLLFYIRNNCISISMLESKYCFRFVSTNQNNVLFNRIIMSVVKYFVESSVVSLIHLALVQPCGTALETRFIVTEV